MRKLEVISAIIFEVSIAAEQKQTYWKRFVCFFVSFHCLQLFYCPPPQPYRCSGVPEYFDNAVATYENHAKTELTRSDLHQGLRPGM